MKLQWQIDRRLEQWWILLSLSKKLELRKQLGDLMFCHLNQQMNASKPSDFTPFDRTHSSQLKPLQTLSSRLSPQEAKCRQPWPGMSPETCE